MLEFYTIILFADLITQDNLIPRKFFVDFDMREWGQDSHSQLQPVKMKMSLVL